MSWGFAFPAVLLAMPVVWIRARARDRYVEKVRRHLAIVRAVMDAPSAGPEEGGEHRHTWFREEWSRIETSRERAG